MVRYTQDRGCLRTILGGSGWTMRGESLLPFFAIQPTHLNGKSIHNEYFR